MMDFNDLAGLNGEQSVFDFRNHLLVSFEFGIEQ